jgi:hypothetical protein
MRLHHHDTHRQLRHGRLSRLMPCLAIAVGIGLALALAGCGVTTVTSTGNGPSQGSGGSAKATGAASTAAPPATATTATGVAKPPSGGLAVRSCLGSFGSATASGTPNVILTPHADNGTASAHVGDLVQVRLPMTLQWRLEGTPADMVMVTPSGVQDDALGMCVWTFRAVSAGTAQLDFAGTAVCERAVPCAQIAIAADFTVDIS